MEIVQTDSWSKRKCHKNKKSYKKWNVNKTDMSSKLKYDPNLIATKPETLPKLKYHQNWSVTKTEKCDQNWNITKTEMSPKLKCNPNWNITKPLMPPTLKISSKSKSRRLALISLALFDYFSLNPPPGQCSLQVI